MKQNCWEFKKCGREPGGAKISELGICPAAVKTADNSLNGGENAGRYCWKIAGTLCGGKLQGSFATKVQSCMKCDFYLKVHNEQGTAFVI